MKTDKIKAIEIDKEGKLHVITANAIETQIYCEAVEVYWNHEKHSFHYTIPQDWKHFEWLAHILKNVEKAGWTLRLTNDTNWINVFEQLRDGFIKIYK